ncbi:oxalate:formate antiporter-like isoform X1 [Elysia marginata]|uniref:Oxalate:formate antiporter-like isoform X1 n=1 Tax=Elysia marginata TaxID=1093978 RepID=A0AAV4GX30_9GAST|nr:oxalate:formate antiporter-like isoform X1 [Elysia marginata]
MRENFVKYCSIVGAHLVMAPLSFFWVYGNLAEYMNSYFQFSCAPGCLDIDSEWILSLYIATTCPGILLTKLLAGKIGLKWIGVVVAILGNAGLFASAWSIQVSVAWTTLLLGVLMGVVQGTTSVVAFENVNNWAPDRAAVLMATTTSTATALSVLQNQLITFIVNPNNIKPNVNEGLKAYFSQPELLARVPLALICYAAITCGTQFVGYILLASPPKPVSYAVSNAAVVGGNTPSIMDRSKPVDQLQPVSNTELNLNNPESYGSNSNIKENSNPNKPSTFAQSNPIQLKQDTDQEMSTNTNQQFGQQVSLKPLEALKTPVFYVLYFYGIVTVYGLLLKGKYYKQFALLYIHNDRFLTLVGTLLPIVSTLIRIILGFLLDKHIITIQDTLVFSLSLNSVLCFFWYLAPQVSDVLYTFLVLGLAAAHTVYSAIIPTACLRVFGPAHFSVNYGLIYSSIFIIGILSAVVVTPMMQGLGWEWVFASCGIACLITLVFAVCVDFNAAKYDATW